MKEVTPDPDVAKGSVFHRLIQRAFPEWFPYDSVNFFHPFYTAETNAKFARQQGYEDVYQFKSKVDKSVPGGYKYDWTASLPKKPAKPVYLSEYAEVKSVLRNLSDDFVNPACTDSVWFPKKVAEILGPGQIKPKSESAVHFDPSMLLDYFVAVTRPIIKREVITVDAQQEIYQIDVTREYAKLFTLVCRTLIANLVPKPGHTRHHAVRCRPPRLQPPVEVGEEHERRVLRKRDLPAHHQLSNFPRIRC